MNLSPACRPPVHAPILTGQADHPRFGEYMAYRSAMTAQLVFCPSFASWLNETLHHESRRVLEYFALGGGVLARGWYVNDFAPGCDECVTHGPFATEAEAVTAARVLRRGGKL